MQDLYWKKLECCLSPARLAAYGQDHPGHRIIASRYLWNIALCESLYAPMHLLEVGLRNAIDRAMVKLTRSHTWYDSVALTSWGQDRVGKAKQNIERSRKEVKPGRVVAELHLGFWTSLFEGHYEKSDAVFLPKGIQLTFPQMPRSLRGRKEIKNRLDVLRKLRNRIFHHERIIHWKNLPEQHGLILSFLGWIHPDLAELAGIVDTFPRVHDEGIDPFLSLLDDHLIEQPDT